MSNKTLLRLVISLLLIRLALSLLPSFEIDMGAWLGWAERLVSVGTAYFYTDAVWTQYTPGYLYWLLAVGKLGWINPLMIKIPTILADILTAYVIVKIVKPKRMLETYLIYLVYVLNPVVIIDGSIWGQIDGILTLLMLSAAYYLGEKKNTLTSFGLLGVALLIKPQAIAIVPIMLFYALINKGWWQTVMGCTTMILVNIIGYLPFFPDHPIEGFIELMSKMGASYPYTSLYAYNIWTHIGMWQADSLTYAGLTYFQWGVLGTGLMNCLVAWWYWKFRRDKRYFYLALALSCLIFFLFPTRVHDRYLYPFFAFLTVTAFSFDKKSLAITLFLMSGLYSLNLYVPYSYYAPDSNGLKNPMLEKMIENGAIVISVCYLLGLIGILMTPLFPGWENRKKSLPVRARESETKKHWTN